MKIYKNMTPSLYYSIKDTMLNNAEYRDKVYKDILVNQRHEGVPEEQIQDNIRKELSDRVGQDISREDIKDFVMEVGLNDYEDEILDYKDPESKSSALYYAAGDMIGRGEAAAVLQSEDFKQITEEIRADKEDEEVELGIEIRDKTIAFYNTGSGMYANEFDCIEPEDKEKILDWVKEGYGEDSIDFSSTYSMVNSEEAEHLFLGKEQMLYNDISKVLANDEFREQLRSDEFEMSDLSEQEFAEHTRDIVAEKVDEYSITTEEAEGYAMNIASDAVAKKQMGEELSADEDYILSGGVQRLVGGSEFDNIINSDEFDNIVEAKVAEKYPEYVNEFITHDNFVAVSEAMQGLDAVKVNEGIDFNQMTFEEAKSFVKSDLSGAVEHYLVDKGEFVLNMETIRETIHEYPEEITRFYRANAENENDYKAASKAQVIGYTIEDNVKHEVANYKEALMDFEQLHADGQEIPAELSERLNESGNYLLEKGGEYGKMRFDDAHETVAHEMEQKKDEEAKTQNDSFSQSM